MRLATTHSASTSKNELTKAKNEIKSNETREVTAHGTNAYRMRTRKSGRVRCREGIDVIIAKIVNTIVATTKDVSKRIPFDNMNQSLSR